MAESHYYKLLRKMIRSFNHVVKYKASYILGFVFIYLLGTFWHMRSVATTDTAFLRVAAYVSPNCLIETPPLAINFGTFHPSFLGKSSAAKSSTNFNVSCTKGVSAIVSIDKGLYPLGASRQMTDNKGGYLSYNLYTTAKNATIWNEENVVRYEAKSTSAYSVVIFAYLPPGEYAKVGTYKDNIVVSVTFLPTGVIRSFSIFVTIVFVPDDVIQNQLVASL